MSPTIESLLAKLGCGTHRQAAKKTAKIPRSVLITGANRGIGLGMVHEFLKFKEVEHLFATARDPIKAKDLQAIGDRRLHIIAMDVQDDDSIGRAYETISKMVGRKGLNLIINNAGVLLQYELERMDRVSANTMMDVNAIGPLIVTQTFLPLLRRAHNASLPMSSSNAAVINITSIAGSHSFNTYGSTFYGDNGLVLPGLIAYCMSKSAENQLTRGLAADLRSEGILVMCFCPGIVKTDMGGDNAYITVEESSESLVKCMVGLGAEHSGVYLSHQGLPIGY